MENTWVDITTIEYAGLYQIQMEANATGRYRHHIIVRGGWSAWINGMPKKRKANPSSNSDPAGRVG